MNHTAKYILGSKIGFLLYGPRICGEIECIVHDSYMDDIDHVFIRTESGIRNVNFPSTKTANLRTGQFIAVRSMKLGP